MTEPARRTPMTRRAALHHLKVWLGVGAAASAAACKPQAAGRRALPEQASTDPDAALLYRYKGIPGGGAMFIDATYDTHGRSFIYAADGTHFATGQFRPGASSTRGYFGDEKTGGLPLPKTLRLVTYPQDAKRNSGWNYAKFQDRPPFLGPPLLDVTVPVASRIPDAVLDRIRKYKGGLKLKLRITRETLLVGWQISGVKDYPYERDRYGHRLITDEDLMIGGDFCERQVYNGWVDGKSTRIVQKGWQIDPRTGRKVETDF